MITRITENDVRGAIPSIEETDAKALVTLINAVAEQHDIDGSEFLTLLGKSSKALKDEIAAIERARSNLKSELKAMILEK